MKQVLVTGAGGYIGARLSKKLAENGYDITAFVTSDPSEHSHWVSLMDVVVVGDIRDESTISDLADRNFDVVVHLISLDHHKSESSPNLVSSINVMPTWNLLDKFSKNGLKQFIYFSTMHVYGNMPKEIITENQLPKPEDVYGLTHLLSENICNYFNNTTETECINVRLSNSYGNPIFQTNNCWWLVINDLCKTLYEERSIKLLSDGSPQRDFIHGDDVVNAIHSIIKYEKNNGGNIFHVGSGETLTILELANIVKNVYYQRYDKEIDIFFPDGSVSKNPKKFNNINRFTLDTSKLNKIGFQKKIDMETGINELFNYLEEISV